MANNSAATRVKELQNKKLLISVPCLFFGGEKRSSEGFPLTIWGLLLYLTKSVLNITKDNKKSQHLTPKSTSIFLKEGFCPPRGKTFVVTKLDRLARSVVDITNIVQKFEGKNVHPALLDKGIDDTRSIYGQRQFNILAVIGEFARGIIRERSYAWRMRALASGVKFGAKPKLTKNNISQMINVDEAPACNKMEIADHYGISRSSVCCISSENCQPCLEIGAIWEYPA